MKEQDCTGELTMMLAAVCGLWIVGCKVFCVAVSSAEVGSAVAAEEEVTMQAMRLDSRRQELLQAASSIFRDRGHPGRARHSNQLVYLYIHQMFKKGGMTPLALT